MRGAQIWPATSFINKVLLAHSSLIRSHIDKTAFHMAERSHCHGDCTSYKAEIFAIHPFTEKVCLPRTTPFSITIIS